MNARGQACALGAALALGAVAGPAAAQVQIGGHPYVKRETRQATRDAMLQQFGGVRAVWGPWKLLAPFDHPQGAANIDAPHPPEAGLVRMAHGGPGPDFGSTYVGKGGAAIGWRDVQEKPDIGGLGGVLPIDLAEGLTKEQQTNAAGYLYRAATAAGAVDVPVAVGSDDGMRLWLNGELLVDDNAERPLDPRAHVLTLKLKPGVNHVFVKVSQGGGEWQLAMAQDEAIDPVAEAALDYQLDEDFPDEESRFYRMITIPHPREVSAEVGGIDVMPDGRPVVCTRRGDVFIIDKAYERPAVGAAWERVASGLQEPLGLRVLREGDGRDGRTGLVMAQRSELTRVVLDRGGAANAFETLCDDWIISGNYHEYAFGPKFDARGDAWVTLNLAHTGGETVMGATVPTRGWAVRVPMTGPDAGKLIKVADGLRSPDGVGAWSDGQMFYTDNQGDFVATNKLSPLYEGSFHGHQASLKFREGYGETWRADGKPVPDITWPAVWFPYKKMGQSASDILLDETGGKFGPFAGQLFIGEQTYAMVFRVFLEKIDGAGPGGQPLYQGACFPFRQGFASGVHRMAFAPDGSMFVGMTDRGWGSTGPKRDGLQRLVWTGKTPFEIREMRATPTGFLLEFTRETGMEATDLARYRIVSWTYDYHPDYGSAEVDVQEQKVVGAQRLRDRMVALTVDQLRAGGMGYVHELTIDGLESEPDDRGVREPLLHDKAYYTLLKIPE